MFVETTKQEKNFGMLAHLAGFGSFIVPFGNIIGPLVVWLLKKDESEYIADQAKEALNFQISFTIYLLVSFLFFWLLFIPTIILGIVWFVQMIVALVKSGEGEVYSYPFTIRFVS